MKIFPNLKKTVNTESNANNTSSNGISFYLELNEIKALKSGSFGGIFSR